MTVPYAFANLSGNIALSKLDSNFNTPITIGNSSVLLGNTITTLNNMTLANVTIISGNVSPTTAISANSGGTGLTSPGTAGNVLTSTGTAWVSSAVPGGGNGAPITAEYVLVSSNANLTSGRILTAGANVTITDNGAGNSIVIAASGGGGGGGNMTLLGALEPTSGSTSISITGLSTTYKSIVAITSALSLGSVGVVYIALSVNNGSSYVTAYPITNNSATPTGWQQIYYTDTASTAGRAPYVSVYGGGTTLYYNDYLSGPVNAIRISTSSTFASGTIFVYGIN
jgi:hypothetical protein